MRHPSPLPDGLVGVPFSTRSALELGISSERLRARDLEATFRGVRAPKGSTTPSSLETKDRRAALIVRCRAYLEHAGPDEFFSHVTAARLHGIPVPWRLEKSPILDVSVFAPSHPPQMRGIRAHRLSRPTPTHHVAGLPCSPPVEVWVQLASLLTVDQLIAAGDGLLRRKRPLVAVDEIAAELARTYRRPGARVLRAAGTQIRAGTDSPKETEMRLILVRGGLPEPVIGHTVYDEGGFFVGTPDLGYPAERVALDYEGDVHRSRQVFREDIERREMFQDAGWHHIRVTDDRLQHPFSLVVRVRSALQSRS